VNGRNLHSTEVTFLVVNGTDAVFRGNCTINKKQNCTYELRVRDNAEPGRGRDLFGITYTIYDSNGTAQTTVTQGSPFVPFVSPNNPSPIVRGNIKVHKEK
jgi:hypothetical protein